MEVLERLRQVSVVSRVIRELENNIGTGDKNLAEFLVDLAGRQRTFNGFRDSVWEAGGGPESFPEGLIGSIFRICGQRQPDNVPNLERGSERVVADRQNGTSGNGPGLTEEKASQRGELLGSNIDLEAVMKRTEQEFAKIEEARSTKPSRDTQGKRGGANRVEREVRHHLEGTGFQLTVGGIYEGYVRSIRNFGVFVELMVPMVTREGRRPEGMVHVSQLRDGTRVSHPSEVVELGNKVWIRVEAIVGDRIALSMKGVDQAHGSEVEPRSSTGGNSSRYQSRRREMSRRGTVSGLDPSVHSSESDRRGSYLAHDSGRARRSIPSPERWELTQLANAGVLPLNELRKAAGIADDDDKDEEDEPKDMNLPLDVEQPEEEVEIEINDEEPAFLRGHNLNRAQPLSPVRIVKNPDGTMQRAAMTRSALAKERREIIENQKRSELDQIPDDLIERWEDPMARDRKLSAELRGMSAMQPDIPEWKKKSMGVSASFGFAHQSSVSMKEQRESLPIFKLRKPLLEALRENQVLVVIGETGSGKTTQMTQYMVEDGLVRNGTRVGCTQPRRVAAMSVAKRVAEERGCRLGEDVGYSIRFEDCTSPETIIKYMTDGMLLREALLDPEMSQYSVIVLDEAHERTISTDVLFGLLKTCVRNRKDLKLVVTSATLDAEKFSTYFFNCPIFTIPGRTFPVEILYSKEPEADYLDGALMTVMQIHLREPPGDILLFLTGQEEIDTSAEVLYERMKSLGPNVPELLILPVYSSLPSEMQTRIFEPAPAGARKVVIATNIAEASLTIDGIYYVVDPGFAKQKVYNPKMGMDSLVVAPISQASARQRSGRAGRTGPGKCFRLYTEHAFKNEMLPTSVPELQRSNLANTVLTLKALGIDDLLHFDFMDPPPMQHLIAAMESLYALGALDEEGLLTRLGRKMAEFPLEPMQSKMLLASVDLGCSDEILTIVAMLSVQSIFYRPRDRQAQADQKKAKFHQVEGDHVTLLTVYDAWKNTQFSKPWCFENFLQSRSLQRAQEIRKQLITIMDRHKLDIISAGRNIVKVRKAIVSGYFVHAAKKDPQEGYKTLVEGQPVYIHPSSSLFHVQPEWVIYHEVVHTTKEYMREVLAIESKWLVELAPRFFKRGDPHQLSRRKKQEKIEPLFNRYAQNQNEWRLSKRMRNR
mmetsp:Transcript_5125/g.10403  ORF Transcript_5125/g.10403 Transcript_5125/m.10403 type:complete len:1163 (-) Transcript_5125:1198-4686(-)